MCCNADNLLKSFVERRVVRKTAVCNMFAVYKKEKNDGSNISIPCYYLFTDNKSKIVTALN
jgi:hypothetical protein